MSGDRAVDSRHRPRPGDSQHCRNVARAAMDWGFVRQ